MKAYCMKCRAKNNMRNAMPVTLKNGRPAVCGACAVCGIRIYRIIGRPAYRSLQNVPEDKVFWCADGRVLKNLDELASALSDMSEETFRHHVTAGNNDFCNWVKLVIGDEKLSADLSTADSAYRAARCIERSISS